MEGFFDSDKFLFKLEEDSGHLMPVHYRELGEKNDNLFSPSVKWSDVAINGVPLEQTFEYEDDITRIQEERSKSSEEQGIIMVNSRVSQSQPLPQFEEVEDKRWVKRLERLYPMNYQEAKKKRKSVERYPVKPKSKKQIRDEKLYCFSDKFQEITDEKLGDEISLEYTTFIHRRGDYKIIKEELMRTPGDPFWPPEYNIIKVPILTKYCPPLHWLDPEVDWEKIWIHVDLLKTGKKRDYHYYPEGDDNSNKPCIYFYDKDSDDLNYDFDWSRDYMNIQKYFGDYNDYY
tara:strand:- start:216 stop:1079 length:864 start_codon:yes stop_codon:yes gene_type:complete